MSFDLVAVPVACSLIDDAGQLIVRRFRGTPGLIEPERREPVGLPE